MPSDPTADPLRSAFEPETFRSQGHALVDLLTEHLQSALQGDGAALTWKPAG